MFELDYEDNNLSGLYLDTDQYINGGLPVVRWQGVTKALLLTRCQQARSLCMRECAYRMAHAALMMAAGEPIAMHEWHDAMEALSAVEERLVNRFVGPIRLCANGRIWN